MSSSADYCQTVWLDFSRCDAASSLAQQVFGKETVFIQCTRNIQSPPLPPNQRLITLITGDPLGPSRLLLEIIKLSRCPRSSSEIPKKTDFITALQHHKIASKCLQEAVWPPQYDLYAAKINDWLPDLPTALIGER